MLVMASKRITPVDIFHSLTDEEKRKVLKVLQQAEQSPCEKLGHKYKVFVVTQRGLFTDHHSRQALCERCGDRIEVK
jgi:hypothetical protein